MKITSGQYRGQNLETLEGTKTRPTLGRVKENVLNMIRMDLTADTRVLDLFAGSGSIGIEFLSNYVGRVDFIEKDSQAINIIKTNLVKVKIETSKFNVLQYDYSTFLKTAKESYDIIYLDPPFDFDYGEILNNIVQSGAFSSNTIVIVESLKSKNIDFSKFNIVKSKNYGIINISLIKSQG
jgi:16S rRNA (guanine966-N2)-methyltransferase